MMTLEYCCNRMAAHADGDCPDHPNPYDCPDRVVIKGKDSVFRLVIHDGGDSGYDIDYCPWCGLPLPCGSVSLGEDYLCDVVSEEQQNVRPDDGTEGQEPANVAG